MKVKGWPVTSTGAPPVKGTTVMVTVSGAEAASPSLTVSEKVSVPAASGALKVGLAAAALESATCVPAVCVHA